MSKRRDEEKWGPHSHCIVCGNAIPEGERTCSGECASKSEEEAKHYKKQQHLGWYLMAALVGIIIVFLVLGHF